MSETAERTAEVTAYLEHRETGERIAVYKGDGRVALGDLLAWIPSEAWRLVLTRRLDGCT